MKLQAISLFLKLKWEVDLLGVMDDFQKALDSGNAEIEHDVLGYQDFWVNGDIVYYAHSDTILNTPTTNISLS